MSRTPLAWLNLGHHRTRTLLAVAGVTFAVVLIFLQLGFLAAAVTGASMIYDAMDYDLLIRSKSYLHLVTCRSFPRERLYQAGGVEGVASVHPFYVSSVFWRHPRQPSRRLIMALGVRPGDRVFRDAELQRNTALLTTPESALVDRMSRREFGPREGRRFGPADIGVETEINGKRVRIVETFSMGTGFAADGAPRHYTLVPCRAQGLLAANDIACGRQQSIQIVTFGVRSAFARAQGTWREVTLGGPGIGAVGLAGAMSFLPFGGAAAGRISAMRRT